MEYMLSAKVWFVKFSTRIVKYESPVVSRTLVMVTMVFSLSKIRDGGILFSKFGQRGGKICSEIGG